MAGYGEIYVPVDASTVNGGIMTLAGSGEMGTGEGDTQGNWWLHWEWGVQNGFSGKGWFWNNPYNKIDDIWRENCGNPPKGNEQSYAATEDGFNRYLSENNIQELDWLFDQWTEGKGEFAMNILLEVNTIQNGGCLELM